MKEQLITFDTGKLAKEKEFDIEVRNYYKEGFPKNLMNHQVDCNFNRYVKLCVSVPTQSLLQKWLREHHSIHIISKPFHDSLLNKTTHVSDVIRIVSDGRVIKSPRLDTYEEALEYALKEGLKLIKQ